MEVPMGRGPVPAMTVPIHINAGGTNYTTTLQTLTKYPYSKLARFFNGSLPIPVDPVTQHYILDINGSVFGHILDFLRYDELLLPDDFSQLQLLKKQAEYFELGVMVEMLARLPKKNHNTFSSLPTNNQIEVKKENPATGWMGMLQGVGALSGAISKMMSTRVDIAVVRYKMRPMSSGSIDIYSLAKPRLREPVPEKPRMKLKPFLGFCTHIMYDVPSSGSTELVLPYALHFVGQFLDLDYHLSSVVNTSNEQKNSKSLEFVLTYVDSNRVEN